MHPETGANLGLAEGDSVKLTVFRPKGHTYKGGEPEPMGSFENHVCFLKGMHPRVMACSHHVGHTEQGRVARADAKQSAPQAGLNPDSTTNKEVDTGLLELLRLPEVKGILADAEPALGEQLDAEWDAATLEEHAVEFCRLFIHPCLCLPLAGRWAEGVEDEQISVRRWFADDSGVSALAPHFAELSDTHVAKILAVRAGLVGVDAGVVASYDEEMIRPWAAAFAEQLASSTTLPLYRAVAAMLRAISE